MKLLRNVYAPMDQNAYLLIDEDTKEAVIIDPGADAPKLIRAIENEGAKLTAILLTHGHGDHIGAVPELKAHFSVPVVALADEADTLLSPELNFTGAFGDPRISLVADRLLTDGETFTFGSCALKALHIAGHTPGGCCYYSEKDGAVFTGDCLFYGSIGRTDFPQHSKAYHAAHGTKELGAGGNMGLLCDGIRAKLFVLPEETKAYPGHGMPTVIGNEKKFNPFLQ